MDIKRFAYLNHDLMMALALGPTGTRLLLDFILQPPEFRKALACARALVTAGIDGTEG